jgi:protocatechuate 3,4-dioxygenase, beta subunit
MNKNDVKMKSKLFLILPFFLTCKVSSENKTLSSTPRQDSSIIGGGCDGCELMYSGMPDTIGYESVSKGWVNGDKKLMIEGKVYQLDGRTPAPNTILYYWHTDDNGLYSSGGNVSEGEKVHGHLRGWVKTDEQGRYKIKTSRPQYYPNENIPAHIHLSVKEPNLDQEYYLDWYFDDDKMYLKHQKKYGKLDRGGTEILRVLLKDDIQIVEHHVILGLNIPNYPKKLNVGLQSGLSIGEDQPSFIPYHAFGPDKNTRTCPVCKYGRYHGIVYFVGNNPDWSAIEKWLIFLDQESISREKYLKSYFVYGNAKGYNQEKRQRELEALGKKLNLQKIALTFVPSLDDVASEANLNKINAEVQNTFIIYKHRTIVEKYIDLQPSMANFEKIRQTVEVTKGAYLHLKEPHDH